MPSEFFFYPFDEGEGSTLTEDRWKWLFTWMRTVGVLTTEESLPEDADLFVAPANIGLAVQVYPGEAFIQGMYWRHAGDPWSLSIIDNEDEDAGEDGYARIDLVVLRCDFPNDIMEYVVIEGEPAEFPEPPEPIQNDTIWDLPLAQVYVEAEAAEIDPEDITDLREPSYQAWTGSSPLVAGEGVTLTYDGPRIIISCNCGEG